PDQDRPENQPRRELSRVQSRFFSTLLVRSIPSEQVAAEFIEDTALNWATNRLASAPTGPEAIIVQEEVVRVLLRSLQATQMAGRLALKLADHIKEHALPKHLYDRIQDELKWV